MASAENQLIKDDARYVVEGAEAMNEIAEEIQTQVDRLKELLRMQKDLGCEMGSALVEYDDADLELEDEDVRKMLIGSSGTTRCVLTAAFEILGTVGFNLLPHPYSELTDEAKLVCGTELLRHPEVVREFFSKDPLLDIGEIAF